MRAAREIRRVLKPGGLVGLCSPDWDGFYLCSPRSRKIEAAAKLFRRLQEAQGGNTAAGRRLGTWLEEAGFQNITLTARYECPEDLAVMGNFLSTASNARHNRTMYLAGAGRTLSRSRACCKPCAEIGKNAPTACSRWRG